MPSSSPAPHPNRPVAEIRYGAVRAAIWRNESDSGTRYSVTFNRRFKDGDQWHTSESFFRDDLLVIAKAANEAHSWIFEQMREAPVTPGHAHSTPAPTPEPLPPPTSSRTPRHR